RPSDPFGYGARPVSTRTQTSSCLSWVKILTTTLLMIFLTFPLGAVIYAHRQDGEVSDNVDDAHGTDVLTALSSVNFWVLFVTSGCTIGSAKAMLNNLSQIGESLGFSKKDIQGITSQWSVFVFFGCYFGGLISDKLLKKFKIGRPWTMAVSQAVMFVGHMI
ncbi:nuclear fusion defective 4-like protein, partial [Tanacetum coccineum]